MGRQSITEDNLGLRVLWPPVTQDDSDAPEATIDIIAIHGKAAHPDHTWAALRAPGLDRSDPESWINWLDDGRMLPDAFPSARIMRFGYLSDWFGENALKTRAASIAERLLHEVRRARRGASDRPIIFIAHSSGGLVLVKTMLQAKHEASKWSGVYDLTVGLVFLGTPFRGTHDMLHGEILQHAEALFRESEVMHENHRASNAENDWLKDLVDRFCREFCQGTHAKIACFHEEKPTDLGLFLKSQKGFPYEPGKYKVMHVDDTSACLDRMTKFIERYPRACDHLSMNKFSGPGHPEWKVLVDVIRGMESAEAAGDKPLFPQGIPIASQAAFDALNKQHDPDCLEGTRTDILHAIRQWVAEPGESRILWMHGTAGAGKSTIARTISRELHDGGQLGASFFFWRDGGDALSRMHLFYSTVASQLASAGPAVLSRHICSAARENPDVLDKANSFQWRNLILKPLKLVKSPRGDATRVIVIDGLDECDDEQDIRGLTRQLQEMTAVTGIRVLIIVFSRPDLPIRDGFADGVRSVVHSVSLDDEQQDTIDNDIRLFLTDRFHHIKRQKIVRNDAWPDIRSISRLVHLSAGLFIYASTACVFVLEDIDRDAEMSLAWFLEEMERTEQNDGTGNAMSEDQDHTDHLDRMYTRILQNALREAQTAAKQDRLSIHLRNLLGSLVTLREPLTVSALESLRRSQSADVRWRLSRLHAVIRVPEDDRSPVRLSHVAFRDFLLDKQRCKDERFVLNSQQDHSQLFSDCLREMSDLLRRDICNLQLPGALRRDLNPVDLEEGVPAQLKYSCKHWIVHLARSQSSVQIVYEFLKIHFLHWLEAMSLIKHIQESTRAIAHLRGLVEKSHSPEENSTPTDAVQGDIQNSIREFIRDAYRFTLFSQPMIEPAPLQVYNAALLFAPRESVIRKSFRNELPHWVTEDGSRNHGWDACLQILPSPFENEIEVIAFSTDTRMVALGREDGVIEMWDSNTDEIAELEGLDSTVHAICISPNGRRLAGSDSSGACRIWNTDSGNLMHTLDRPNPESHNLIFSNDSLTVAVATCSSQPGSAEHVLELVLWDVATGQTSRQKRAVSRSPTETLAISTDLETVALPTDYDIQVLTLSPNKRSIRGKTLRSPSREGPITGCTFSPDHRLLASSSTTTLRIWHLSTRECLATITPNPSPSGKPLCLLPVFSPEGQKLAAWAGVDDCYRVGIWRVPTGEPINASCSLPHWGIQWGSGGTLAFAPDAQSLVVLAQSNGEPDEQPLEFSRWDAVLPQASSAAVTRRRTRLRAVAVSEEGGMVAVGRDDGSLRVYDAVTMEERWEAMEAVEESDLGIRRDVAAFSANGKRLAYESSREEGIRVWDTKREVEVPEEEWVGADMEGIRIVRDVPFNRPSLRDAPSGDASVLGSHTRVEGGFEFVEHSDGPWISWRGERVLLLPPQFRLQEVRDGKKDRKVFGTSGDTVVLGLTSGRFSVLRFDPSRMAFHRRKSVSLD